MMQLSIATTSNNLFVFLTSSLTTKRFKRLYNHNITLDDYSDSEIAHSFYSEQQQQVYLENRYEKSEVKNMPITDFVGIQDVRWVIDKYKLYPGTTIHFEKHDLRLLNQYYSVHVVEA